MPEATQPEAFRYLAPSAFDRLFSRVLGGAARLGVGVWGARQMRVRGRRSGQVRTTVVNLLEVDGHRYLVAPRGATEWVRNLRAAGGGDLRLGRRVEPFRATELDDGEKAPVLAAYLRRWGWEVGRFFEGLDRHAGPEALLAAAGGFPVFEVRPAS